MASKDAEQQIDAEKLAALSDSLGALMELANGERAKAIQAGYEKDAADEIGMLIYSNLVNGAFEQNAIQRAPGLNKKSESINRQMTSVIIGLSLLGPIAAFFLGLSWIVLRDVARW